MGPLLEIKIKELTDAEKHKGRKKIICLTDLAEQSFSQRLSNHLKLQSLKNALILI